MLSAKFLEQQKSSSEQLLLLLLGAATVIDAGERGGKEDTAVGRVLFVRDVAIGVDRQNLAQKRGTGLAVAAAEAEQRDRMQRRNAVRMAGTGCAFLQGQRSQEQGFRTQVSALEPELASGLRQR